jgi:hypothetical protein
MKKFVYMAAAAAVALASTAASASTAIEVGRQTLLDNGSAPATLRMSLSGSVTANGTHSLTCTLSWTGAAPTGTALDDFNALNIAASSSSSSSAPVSGGTVSLLYSGRINPKGMAVGDAIYNGSYSHGQTGNSNVSGLSCPNGATLSLGYRAAVAGNPGQPQIDAVSAQPATYEQMPEPVCKAAALADNGPGGTNILKVGDCPKVDDLSKMLTPPVQAVPGQSYIAPTTGTPEVQAQSVTYSYTPSYSFSQTSLTVMVDGYSFTVN